MYSLHYYVCSYFQYKIFLNRFHDDRSSTPNPSTSCCTDALSNNLLENQPHRPKCKYDDELIEFKF